MKPTVYGDWEPLIGLEVHVELNTVSKLFSTAPNRFGDEPNTNITCVCTGQPGTLPVLNTEAVRKAVRFGCAVKGEVAFMSRFDRKAYFYPDSPRNFQITQFAHPIVRGGTVRAVVNGVEREFSLGQTHLEDDAGMLKHFSTFAGVDYNRAGVPLIEIVSTPCMFSSQDAVAYAQALYSLLRYIDVSDCNMEEGSIRFDVNVSVRPRGSGEMRNKVEIKNMNSFHFMEMALESEMKRQIELYRANPEADPATLVPQATYRWDPERKETILMRLKESAEDYRYFREPDLPAIQLTREYIEEVAAEVPELPYDKYKRYLNEYNLAEDAAAILVAEKPVALFFEEAASQCRNVRALSNWIIVEFPGRFKALGGCLSGSGIRPCYVARLVNMIEDGTITGKIAKVVADLMVKEPLKSPDEIVSENPDLSPMTDDSFLEKVIEDVIRDHDESVKDYRSGKEKALGFLIGQIMKVTSGKAHPKKVNEILKEKIGKI